MKKRYIPYLILTLLFIGTGLSFLDRQVLSITIIKIQEEFRLTDVQYGWVNTSFLISYAIMFTVGGRMMDTLGGKLGMGLSLGIWSLATFLQGSMTGFYELLALRFLLGIGEGGAFPGAAKIVYEWFSEKRRGLANGIAIGGAAIGAVIAPPLVTFISVNHGWRWAFYITGIIGFVWLVLWFIIPWKNKNTSPGKEKSIIKNSGKSIPIIQLLKKKETLTFILIRFMLDPVVYFIMFWVPKYLNEVRSVPFELIGDYFWMPFLGLGVANIIGGWSSDLLLKRGRSINYSRKTIMGMSAAIFLVAPLITTVSSVLVAVLLMTLLMVAHGFWITNYITAITDMFGAKGTATVVGLSGTAGAVSSLVINPLIGVIIGTWSYTPIWIVVGMLYPLAFILFVLLIPKIKSLNL